MANVIYSMSSSLDGYVAGPDGDISWGAPDAELHMFHNDRTRALSAHLLGRRLYETMVYWERDDPSWGAVERDFAEIWRALPKIVFSTTLTAVEGNARLASGTPAEELAKLDGDVGAGGAELAAGLLREGLVDEVHAFVCPVILGQGTPFLPAVDHAIALELAETRTFASRVVHARYRVAR